MRRIGVMMTIFAWIIFLGMLTFLFAAWQKQQDFPNEAVQSIVSGTGVTVTLKANRQHHYVVKGKVNGVWVTFLLDTGATDVSIPAQLEKKLGLARFQPLRARTASGVITVYGTRLDTLSIGGIQLQDVRASINPYMQGDEILLGMSALKRLEFTQRDGVLILRQQRPGP